MLKYILIIYWVISPFFVFTQTLSEPLGKEDSILNIKITSAFQKLRSALVRKKLAAVQRIPKAKDELLQSGFPARQIDRLSCYLDSIRDSAVEVRNFHKARRTFRRLESPEEKIPKYLTIEKDLVEANQYLNYFGYTFLDWQYPHRVNEGLDSYFEEFQFLQLDSSDVVADVGAQYGIFSLAIAYAYPNIDLYLTDIEEMYLEELKDFIDEGYLPERSGKLHISFGVEKATLLPKGTFDHVILRNTYHHIEYPAEILHSISEILKPDGSLLIIEDVKDHPTDDNHCEEAKKISEVLESLNDAAYKVERTKMGKQYLLLEASPSQVISPK